MSVFKIVVLLGCLFLSVVWGLTNPNPSEAELWKNNLVYTTPVSDFTDSDYKMSGLVLTRKEATEIYEMNFSVDGRTIKYPTVALATTDLGNRVLALTHRDQFMGVGMGDEFYQLVDFLTFGNTINTLKVATNNPNYVAFYQAIGFSEVTFINFDLSNVVIPADIDILVVDLIYNIGPWSSTELVYVTNIVEAYLASGNKGLVIGGESTYYKWTDYSCGDWPGNRVLAKSGIIWTCTRWNYANNEMDPTSFDYLTGNLYNTVEYLNNKYINGEDPLLESSLLNVMGFDQFYVGMRSLERGCWHCSFGRDSFVPIEFSVAYTPIVNMIGNFKDGCEIGGFPITHATDVADAFCVELHTDYNSIIRLIDSNMIDEIEGSEHFPMMNAGLTIADVETVTFDLTVSRCNLQSLGLFALPGVPVTITVPSTATQYLRAAIGIHKGNVRKFNTWTRLPNSLYRSYDIDSTTTTIISPYGGIFYLEFNCQELEDHYVSSSSPIVIQGIQVTNVVRGLHYEHGITTELEWNDQLANNPAPWAELEFNDLIYTFRRSSVEIYNHQHMVALGNLWDNVNLLMTEFRALENELYKERGISDIAVAYGYMYASYPQVGPLGEGVSFMDVDSTIASGKWGWFHELGHRMERGSTYDYLGSTSTGLWNMWSGNVEVFTNTFVCYSYDNLVPNIVNDRCYISASDLGTVNKIKNNGDTWGSGLGAFDKLNFYIYLKEAFGWESITQTLVEGRNYSWPSDQEARRIRFEIILSSVVQRDMSQWMNVYSIYDITQYSTNLSNELTVLNNDYQDPIVYKPWLPAHYQPDPIDNCLVQPYDLLICHSLAGVDFPNSFTGISDCEICLNFHCSAPGTVTLPFPESTCDYLCETDEIANDKGVCETCHSTCATCTAPNDMLACSTCNPTHPLVQDGICVSSCSNGYFLDNNSCQMCDSTCLLCSGPLPVDCTNCPPGQLIFEGTCVTQCPPNTFIIDAQLIDPLLNNGDACVSSCPITYFGNTLNGQCQSCGNNCDICDNESTCTQCTNPEDIPISGECQPPCLDFDINSNSCLDCRSDLFLYQGQCINQCPSRTFLQNDECIDCHSSCLTCDQSFDQCTSCDSQSNTPYFSAQTQKCLSNCTLSNDNDVFMNDFSCVPICPSHTFSLFSTCTMCSNNCNTCENSADNCISCDLSGTFPILFQNSCYNQCPSSFFLFENECLTTCPDGLYGESSTNECTECSSDCFTCSVSPTTCTSCDSDKVFHNNQCLIDCPDGLYPDPTSQTCVPCVSPCLTCQSSLSCTSCIEGFELDQDTCFPHDDDGLNDDGDDDGNNDDGQNDDGQNDDGQNDDGQNDDGQNDDGQNDDGQNDDGQNDDGQNDDGQNDDGQNDDGQNDDGQNDDGQNDDGQNDDGQNDDGQNDDGQNDDGQNDDGQNEDDSEDEDDGQNEDDGEDDGDDNLLPPDPDPVQFITATRTPNPTIPVSFDEDRNPSPSVTPTMQNNNSSIISPSIILILTSIFLTKFIVSILAN